MYIFMTREGLVPAYEGFDIDNPEWDKLKDVECVYFVNKMFTKQMKFVAKPLAERKKITEELGGEIGPKEIKKRKTRAS